MKVRIAGVKKHSFVDGPGVRYVIFFQGCPHECEGCHNPDTHDPMGGTSILTDEILDEILKDKYIDGVTLSGGDPFFQPNALRVITRQLAKKCVNTWVYTGFTFEQLQALGCEDILEQIDVLVDGRFEQDKAGEAYLRGSTNQRLIDAKETLKRGKICLWAQ